MVSRTRKTNPRPKPTKNPTKSLKKQTCKAPPKKSKRLRGSKPSLGWSDLPCDLFVAISSRLPLKSRYILGFVCTTWSGFVSTTLPPIKPKFSSPWLLSQLNNSSKFLCHHIETQLSFSLGPYPQIEGFICIGSQDGWLILIGYMLGVCFFNPLSESCFILSSPICYHPAGITSTKKNVFSSQPKSPDFEVVIVLHSRFGLSFIFWNARTGRWGKMLNDLSNDPRYGVIYDIFRLEGSNKLYAINVDAQLHMLHFNDGKDVYYFYHKKDMCTGLHIKKNLYWDWPRKCTQNFVWNSFMVLTKDLKGYEVSRIIERNAIDQPAHADEISVDCWSDCLCESCKVHFRKLAPEENASLVTAQRKKPLKGHSFFVGENQMIAHETKGFSKLQPDCVYFVDSRRDRPSWSSFKPGRYDLFVLDVLARKTIKEYRPSCALPAWPPPFWFVPMVPEWSWKKRTLDRLGVFS